ERLCPFGHFAGPRLPFLEFGDGRLRFLIRNGGDDHDRGIPIATPVYAAKALHHALPGNDVANCVVGVQIHPHFTRGGGDHECWPLGLACRPCQQPPFAQLLRGSLTTVSASRANEKLDINRLAACGLLAHRFLTLARLLATRAEDEDSAGHFAFSANRPGLASERS